MADLDRLLSYDATDRAARAVHDKIVEYSGCEIPWAEHDQLFQDRMREHARLTIEAALEVARA